MYILSECFTIAKFDPHESNAHSILGCTSTNSKEILEFLQSVPTTQIVKHLQLFSFIVKDDLQYPDPFEAYKTDKINPVDLMVYYQISIHI